MTPGGRRPTPALVGALGALVLAVPALGACSADPPLPTVTYVPTSGSSGTSGTSGSAGPTSSSGTPAPAATGADGLPVPTASGPSAVDSSRLRSEADLPAVFGCTPGVSPITIPAATVPAAPPSTDAGDTVTATGEPSPTATVTVTPEVVVCGSSLVDGRSLYLWYAPTAQARAAAVQAALELAAHVRAGPNWVAGGSLDPTMGTVGGEVYR